MTRPPNIAMCTLLFEIKPPRQLLANPAVSCYKPYQTLFSLPDDYLRHRQASLQPVMQPFA
uniref:Transposase n=1 Tax=Mesocestoides corti TaxID=53468 RepID=A0A5K3FLJ2_MESCO